jgi:lipopolysaccharide biosynthesis glycosyltransferase
MSEKNIPVVFATDENYVVPTYVAAYSMLKNAKLEWNFDIYVMIPDSMPEKGKNVLSKLEEVRDNCKVNFLNMKNAFQNVEMQISYITPATYYRLLLPELLPQYDKCLYLDSDIIVVGDVSEIYDAQKQDMWLTGVVAGNPALSSLKGQERLVHSRKLGINTIDTYVNAGVLVFNLKAMRDYDLVKAFMDRVPMKYPYQDQDILNAVCFEHIQFADRKYNVCPLNGLTPDSERNLTKSEIEVINSAYKSPAIVHYAQPQKPWLSRSFPMASYWWKYYDAIDPKFREEYLDEFIRKNRKNAIKVRIKHSKLVMGTWQMLKKIKKNH